MTLNDVTPTTHRDCVTAVRRYSIVVGIMIGVAISAIALAAWLLFSGRTIDGLLVACGALVLLLLSAIGVLVVQSCSREALYHSDELCRQAQELVTTP